MSTLMEELTAIKAVEDKLTANKVANFAYTDHAYNNPLTEADGVETYSVDNEQNIPVANASILKVNATVLTKGWRAQASAITRMLMNHFLGRCSYNLNKVNDLFSLLLTKVMAFLGSPNGIATLDANGRIPYSQLPESAVELKGYWNADTNTPSLADGTGTNGDEYIVSVAGTQDLGSGSQYFNVGDRVLYTGGVWKNITSGFVRTVNSVAPDAQGNVKAVLGSSSFPITLKILNALLAPVLATNWYKKTEIPSTAGGIQQIAYNGNIWVAVGVLEGLWWSEDGREWTESSPTFSSVPTASDYRRRLVFNNGLWHISNADGLWWSEDGKNWTLCTGLSTTTTKLARNVIYANDTWVCGITAGGVWKSSDGKAWSNIVLPTPSPSSSAIYNALNIVYANNLWLLSPQQGKTYCSTDLENWTEGNNTANIQSAWAEYMNGLFFRMAEDTEHLSWSEDGYTWTACTGFSGAGSYSAPHNLVYNSNLFVLGSKNAGVWYSEDGKAWIQSTGISSSAGTGWLYEVNGYVFAKVSTDIYRNKVKGEFDTWVKCSIPTEHQTSDPSGKHYSRPAYKDGIYFLIYNNYHLYYSIDGVNWHLAVSTEAGTGIQAVSYGKTVIFTDELWALPAEGVWYTSLEDLIESGAIDLGADIPLVNS